MDIGKAKQFADKLIGFELCTGADETEAAQYVISPVVRSFLEGALGDIPSNAWRCSTEEQCRLGEFLVEAGQALVFDARKEKKP